VLQTVSGVVAFNEPLVVGGNVVLEVVVGGELGGQANIDVLEVLDLNGVGLLREVHILV